jgi:hypothetical protein
MDVLEVGGRGPAGDRREGPWRRLVGIAQGLVGDGGEDGGEVGGGVQGALLGDDAAGDVFGIGITRGRAIGLVRMIDWLAPSARVGTGCSPCSAAVPRIGIFSAAVTAASAVSRFTVFSLVRVGVSAARISAVG